MFSYSSDIYSIICSLLAGKLMKSGSLPVSITQREKNLLENISNLLNFSWLNAKFQSQNPKFILYVHKNVQDRCTVISIF